MMKITNTGRRLGLPGRPSIILATNETVEITTAQYHSFCKNRIVERWIASGLLLVTGAPDDDVPEVKMEIKKPEEASIEGLPEGIKGEGVELHHAGRGQYHVYVNGFKVTDKKVKKAEAEMLAKDYQ